MRSPHLAAAENHLRSVIHRLDAWADTAHSLSLRLPDSQAQPHRNLCENYTALVREIQTAIDHIGMAD